MLYNSYGIKCLRGVFNPRFTPSETKVYETKEKSTIKLYKASQIKSVLCTYWTIFQNAANTHVSQDECCVRGCQQGLHLLLAQFNFGARLSSNSRPICLLWGSNMLNLVFPLLGIWVLSSLRLNVYNFIWQFHMNTEN